jgi:hypothetical protein
LLTPTPIPVVKLPEPNGFDDFVAAGRMIGPTDGAKLVRWDQLLDKELRTILARHAAAFDRMRKGLQKSCWHPYGYVPRTTDDEVTVGHLLGAMGARCALADRNGSVKERLAAYLDLLRVSFAGDRGTGTTFSIPAQYESYAFVGLSKWRTQYSAQQCAELAADLWTLEKSRESWQIRAERQRIIDENVDWQWRLQAILADWSGTERNEWRRQLHSLGRTNLRLLIADLGVRAHQLDMSDVPTTLEELVPRYLPAVPDDPYGNGPIKYQRSDNGYTVYSVGLDKEDNGGQPITNPAEMHNEQTGDLTSTILLPVTVPDRSSSGIDGAKESKAPDAADEKPTATPTENP